MNVLITYFSGGSLIAPDMVLSAAHCAGYASTVELGRFDRTKGTLIDEQVLETLLSESQNGVINLMAGDFYESIEVEFEIKHPAYDSTTVDNDFLLLKLNKPTIVPNPPMANLNTDPDVPEAKGTELLVMGWGDTDADPNINTPSDVLLGADLNYLDNNECRTIEGEVQDEEEGTMFVSFRPMITVSFV
jgi:secreted trypsin-like serine protease